LSAIAVSVVESWYWAIDRDKFNLYDVNEFAESSPKNISAGKMHNIPRP
jgi:hypothetical protein